MLDTRMRAAVAPMLDHAGSALARVHVNPLAITGVGWVMGVGACVTVALHAWPLALGLWLANRLFDGLDGATARASKTSELGGFLDIVADFSIYSGFVLALAIAVPPARLACIALLTAYYISGTALLALSSLVERRQLQFGDNRSIRFAGGLAEGTETIIVYVLFLLLPSHTALIAWAFTVAVAITIGQRLVLAVALLRPFRVLAAAGEDLDSSQPAVPRQRSRTEQLASANTKITAVTDGSAE